MFTRPARRSRFSCALRVRIRLASPSASIRCVKERSGAAVGTRAARSEPVAGDLVAAGMGGDYTHAKEACNTAKQKTLRNNSRPPVNLQGRSRLLETG